jgi:succinoglycan biosynthesis transport protein ExoP
MFLVQLVRILWARKWIAIATLVSSLVVAFIATRILPARYEGVSTVLLDVGLEGDVVTGQNMGGFAREYQRSLIALLQSDRVALEVVKRLNLTSRPD